MTKFCLHAWPLCGVGCRYIGVSKDVSKKRYPYVASFQLTHEFGLSLGYYKTEEQAAMSFDQCCIYQVGQFCQPHKRH